MSPTHVYLVFYHFLMEHSLSNVEILKYILFNWKTNTPSTQGKKETNEPNRSWPFKPFMKQKVLGVAIKVIDISHIYLQKGLPLNLTNQPIVTVPEKIGSW